MQNITERTTLSIAVVVVLIGAASWMSKIYFVAEAAATRVEQVSLKQERYSEDISDVKRDVAVIKNILEKGKK